MRLRTYLTLIAIIIVCEYQTAVAQNENTDTASLETGFVFDTSNFTELSYRMVGPTRGGRVTAVAGHQSDPSYYLMGATGGGLWETKNYGGSWENISDGFFATPSIGSIDVSDSNPSVIYVGTGSDGIRSNVIIGKGIYKSADSGETWEMIGLEDAGQIASVVVHPTNPEVVYAAALGSPFGPGKDRGVYRTLDGGKSWENVLFISEQTGAVDIELHPTDPTIVYASVWRAERKPWTIISGDDTESGIFRSSDSGSSWTRITKGIPDGLVGKIDFAVSPADPTRVYALIESKPEEEGLYRSNDAGLSWTLISTEPGIMDRPFYYTNVDADPSDADVVYVNSTRFFKSTDGGYTFDRRSTPHGDNHDMWINPDDGNIFIQSNDGGANVTLDGGSTWSTQLNQPTAELYQVNVDDRQPYWLYSGQQDNSTIAVPSNPPDYRPGGAQAYWEAVGGCETGPAVPKPGDPNIVYSNCKGRFGRYNRETGQEQQYYVGAVDMYGRNPSELPYRFQRVVPIEVSPHDPNVIYHGSQFVHRTMNEGLDWETISPDLTAFKKERQVISGGPITRDITGEEHYSTLYVIEESPVKAGIIWTGANDGPVHISKDNGVTWQDVSPRGLPPEGRIQRIEPSPHNAGKAYIAAYRYLLDDWEPYIFRTSDYGQTWTRLTDGKNGIPSDFPTWVVREDPTTEGLLYAGTEFGTFVSFDDGLNWQSFQQNLPVTPITDLKIVGNDMVVSTMGRAFWILDNISPLRLLSESQVSNPSLLFPVPDARIDADYSGRQSETGPEYRGPGATIDFYIGETSAEIVRIDIVDSGGNTLRSYSSDSLDAEIQTEQGMRGPPFMAVTNDISSDTGFHRFVWNLRHTGAINTGGSRSRGPLVAPGRYEAVVSIDDTLFRQPFNVEANLRVQADGVSQEDLEAQESLALQIRTITSELSLMIADIDSLLIQFSDKESKDVSALKELRADLLTDTDDSYMARKFGSQLGYLSSMVTRAMQRPGTDAFQRFDQLNSKWGLFQERFTHLSESITVNRSK